MTILVTGGAGFIGSHTCESLLSNKEEVVCLDNFNDYYPSSFKQDNIKGMLTNKNFILEKVDITDNNSLAKIFSKHKFQKIIHLAAMAGVRNSFENPDLYYKVNVNGTFNLLDLAKRYRIENFIFGSSSSVYGQNQKIPFNEEDETNNIISPYAKTKKEGELLCKRYGNDYNIPITCLRFFTVYGPKGRPDMAPYKFTESILNGKEIEVYGDGNAIRDFTYISDTVSGIISAIDKPFEFEIINIASSNKVTLNSFISILQDLIGKQVKVKYIQKRKGDVDVTFADISKANKLLGYRPKMNLKHGLSKFIEWFKDNRLQSK